MPALLMSLFLLSGLLACDTPTEPPTTPPIATGELCVDVEPADARVVVGETVLTDRCTQLTGMYSNRTTLKVTAPGYQPHEAEVSPIGTETIKVTLTPELPTTGTP